MPGGACHALRNLSPHVRGHGTLSAATVPNVTLLQLFNLYALESRARLDSPRYGYDLGTSIFRDVYSEGGNCWGLRGFIWAKCPAIIWVRVNRDLACGNPVALVALVRGNFRVAVCGHDVGHEFQTTSATCERLGAGRCASAERDAIYYSDETDRELQSPAMDKRRRCHAPYRGIADRCRYR
jgi:hypothetical protein